MDVLDLDPLAQELGLLETEAEVSGSASTVEASSRPEFSGSLDYIDNLPSAGDLSISMSRRDPSVIASGLINSDEDKSLPLPSASPTDFRVYQDRRLFHPDGDFAPLGSSRRSATDWVAPGQKEYEEQDRRLKELERKALRRLTRVNPNMSQIAFKQPDKVVICAKRKIRREVMAASFLLGKLGFRKPRFHWWSKVIC